MKRVIAPILFGIPVMIITLWVTTRGASELHESTTISKNHVSVPRCTDGVIQGIGFVEPATEVRRLVFKLDGIISNCPAEVGHAYKKGDVLMQLDGRTQLAAAAVAQAEWRLACSERDKVESGVNPHQIASAEQKVETLKEQVRYSSREHDRTFALASRNSVSPSEAEKTLTEMKQKQTELKQAEADLRHLRQNVRREDKQLACAKVDAERAKLDLANQFHADTFLRAPFDGTVLEILKREGEGSRLFDSEPVVIFADLSRLRVRAEVDERFVSTLGVGCPAIVLGRGLGEGEYAGRVKLIKPIMGKKTVFSRSSTERKDLDVLQVLLEMEPGFVAPVGLEVDVRITSREVHQDAISFQREGNRDAKDRPL